MKQTRNGAAQKRKAGFIVFVLAVLVIDFAVGFVYGFIGEPGSAREGAIRWGPGPSMAEESTSGALAERPEGASANDAGYEKTGSNAAAGASALIKNDGSLAGEAVSDDDSGKNDLSKTGTEEDIHSQDNHDSGAEETGGDEGVQENATADPDDDVEIVTVDVYNDGGAEGSPSANKPIKLTEDLKKADNYLEKGRSLLATWNTTRAGKDIKDAAKALRKAQDYYRKASESSPDDPYIERQLNLANQFLYLALKSSPY